MSKYFTRTITTTTLEIVDAKTDEVLETLEPIEGKVNLEKVGRDYYKKHKTFGFYVREKEVNEELRKISMDDFMKYSTVVEKDDNQTEEN